MAIASSNEWILASSLVIFWRRWSVAARTKLFRDKFRRKREWQNRLFLTDCLLQVVWYLSSHWSFRLINSYDEIPTIWAQGGTAPFDACRARNDPITTYFQSAAFSTGYLSANMALVNNFIREWENKADRIRLVALSLDPLILTAELSRSRCSWEDVATDSDRTFTSMGDMSFDEAEPTKHYGSQSKQRRTTESQGIGRRRTKMGLEVEGKWSGREVIVLTRNMCLHWQTFGTPPLNYHKKIVRTDSTYGITYTFPWQALTPEFLYISNVAMHPNPSFKVRLQPANTGKISAWNSYKSVELFRLIVGTTH